jgi:hypothetical protein
MASSNAPTLAKILDAIAGLNTRMTSIESKVDILGENVTKLMKYNDNESKIQEATLTSQVKKALEEDIYIYPTYTIKIVQYGNFFTHKSNNAVTDIDGCLLVTDMTRGAFTGPLRNALTDTLYFIEAKHGFTASLIDKKLRQFCTILSTLNDVRNKKLVPNSPPKTKFDKMVTDLKLESFPADIRFVFASDYIDPDIAEFISGINHGEIDEKTYNTYLMRQLYSHKLIGDILKDDAVSPQMKSIFRDGKAPIEYIYDLFNVNNVSVSNRPGSAYEKGKASIMSYKDRILPMLPPYRSVKGYHDRLRGKLSLFYNGMYVTKQIKRNASLANGI